MKVIAIKQGYFGKLRGVDEVFDVPDGAKASWFTPVDKKGAAEGKGDAKPSDGLKVDELKAALVAKGISVPDGAKKDELAALLDAAPQTQP